VQLRCTIVDDDASFLKVAQTLASTCAEAVERIGALRPDVVLIDMRLGVESSFDAGSWRPTGRPRH
jgi:CheY-like chemotaxis protein